jgi:V/A-type H+-transporting ATPase subunit F
MIPSAGIRFYISLYDPSCLRGQSLSSNGIVVVMGDRVNLPLFRSIGLEGYEVRDDGDVIEGLKVLAGRKDVSLVIVLKHVIKDEQKIVEEAQKIGIPILVLPTLWAPAEKVNVEKLLAKALGLG